VLPFVVISCRMSDTVVAFRIPTEILKRVDRQADLMQKREPGLKLTRAAAVRLLLVRALDAAELLKGRK